MANTYTRLYFHVIFAVKGRENDLSINWKERLFQYISGIITNKNQKLMIVNGTTNHIHLLIGTQPDCNLSELIRDIKSNSSKFINENKFVFGKFEWQRGYGAFTIGYSQLEKIIDYIKFQEEHHKTKSFKDEYIGFLKLYNIEFSNDYIFEDN